MTSQKIDFSIKKEYTHLNFSTDCGIIIVNKFFPYAKENKIRMEIVIRDKSKALKSNTRREAIMASLTHVCMWSKNGWKQITAEEASELHPEGTVSAYSGLFMCELCGQYVSLTAKGRYNSYFRHTSNEKSKDCPDKISGTSYIVSYDPSEHELPIRIIISQNRTFHFELGLVCIPQELLSENMQIKIIPNNRYSQPLIYSRERLNSDSISYVSLGEIPYSKYHLDIIGVDKRIQDYWPNDITGIDVSGTLFEKNSGIRLPYDSDIQLNVPYYYLTTDGNLDKYRYSKINNISVEKIFKRKCGFSYYYLYEIVANSMNEAAAKFFLEHHYRLTENPIAIQPIWPPYIENRYMIKHNEKNTFFHVKGNIQFIKTFPPISTFLLCNLDTSKLYELEFQDRQQLLISAGRIHALQYTYFWREPITYIHEEPKFLISDIFGNMIEFGDLNEIPPKGILRIKSNYDGKAVIHKNNFIINKIKVNANQLTELYDIAFETCISFYVGLDCVRKIAVKRLKKDIQTEEAYFFEEIIHMRGAFIPIPHSLKNIARAYRHDAAFYQWIMKCIREGKICEQAFRKLQKAYLQRTQQ